MMVRTTVIDGRIALVKECVECGLTLECSPDEHSRFPWAVNPRGRVYYRSWCKTCWPAHHSAAVRKHRQTPGQRQRETEDFRMWRRMRDEREGRVLVPVPAHGEKPRVRVEPFRAWLHAYAAKVGVEPAAQPLLSELGLHGEITGRRMQDYLRPCKQRFVMLDVVDLALLNAFVVVTVDGRDIFTLEDLYPEIGRRAA